jgi:hypothetical protein
MPEERQNARFCGIGPLADACPIRADKRRRPSRIDSMLKQALALMFVAALWSAPCGAAEVPGAQWIVVAAPALRPSLEPLIERRRAQGFQVVIIDTTNALTPAQIQGGDGVPLQARLKEQCARFHGVNLILLAGNATASNADAALQTTVPALPGTTGRMRGMPGDYGYSMPDAKGKPTVAVGRFPAANAEQARAMAQKTLSLEEDTRPGAWRNRLFLFMGETLAGTMGNLMVEPALAAGLAQLHPSWTLRAESTTPSRFQMPEALLHDTAMQSLEEGDLFSVFLVHSRPEAIFLETNRWITRNDLAQARTPRGAGVFFTCGCFACQLRGTGREGFGLAAVRNPAGPVAVMGATGEDYGAGPFLAGEGLMQSLAKAPFPSRLGDYWLAVQASLAEAPMDELTFRIANYLDHDKFTDSLPEQRREHLEMWILLGDPALRLPIPPLDVTLESLGAVVPGKPMTVRGALPGRLAGAVVTVTLERPLGAEPAGSDNAGAPTAERCARANNFVLATARAVVTGNQFTCPLTPPAALPWSTLVLRATAATANESALGVLTVSVDR